MSLFLLVFESCDFVFAVVGHSKLEKRISFKVALLQKRIPVGAKEESWVSAQEILKRFLRDS